VQVNARSNLRMLDKTGKENSLKNISSRSKWAQFENGM
jgi:hypothetical protein